MEVPRQVGSLSRVRREGRADHSYETAEVHELPLGRVLFVGVSSPKKNRRKFCRRAEKTAAKRTRRCLLVRNGRDGK